MSEAITLQELEARRITHWLLAILSFAVTREPADGMIVLAMAKELDQMGWRAESLPTFKFFTRTSRDFCGALADMEDPKNVTILRLHLKRIDDCRLKRALEAALEIKELCPAARTTPNPRKRARRDLWKGLGRQ